MTAERLLMIGAGAHAREIVEILRSRPDGGSTLVGVVSDGPGDDELLGARGVPRLGGVADAALLADEIVIAIGSSAARRRISAEVSLPGARPIISPRTTVAGSSEVGHGCVIFPGVTLNVDVRLGAHVHVNSHSNISHDCVLDDFVTIGPGVTLAGRVTVGADATIWSGATVIPGVSIGPRAVIGAGAVVIDDVPADATAVGVPARVR